MPLVIIGMACETCSMYGMQCLSVMYCCDSFIWPCLTGQGGQESECRLSISKYIYFSKDQSVSMYDYYGLIAKQWTQTWWEKKYIGPWTYNWKYRFRFWTFSLPIHLGVKKITIKEIKEWHWHLTCICKYYKSALKWEHTSGTCLRSFKGKYLVITAWFLQALAQYIRICI